MFPADSQGKFLEQNYNTSIFIVMLLRTFLSIILYSFLNTVNSIHLHTLTVLTCSCNAFVTFYYSNESNFDREGIILIHSSRRYSPSSPKRCSGHSWLYLTLIRKHRAITGCVSLAFPFLFSVLLYPMEWYFI